MKTVITAEQHNALDRQLDTRMDGLGDIRVAYKNGKLGDAERLAREYADELHVLAALRGMDEQAELRAEPRVVRRVMERMRAIAEGDTAGLGSEMEELRKFTARNQLVVEACASLLSGLDGHEGEGDGQA